MKHRNAFTYLQRTVTCVLRFSLILKRKLKLKKSHALCKGSALSNQCPFLDSVGIIRAGGRLEALEFRYDVKHSSCYHIITPS